MQHRTPALDYVTEPPRLGLTDARTVLSDFAIVTYDVDPATLVTFLPKGLEPDVFALDDGRLRGFVSAVSFTDVDFRFGLAPFLRITCAQVNYRAQVRHEGQRGVWFFGTTLASRWVAIPRYLWRMPWHRSSSSVKATWLDDRCTGYRLQSEGTWGKATVELTGTEEPLGRLDGFADAHETLRVLTHPLTGWFRRGDGQIGAYDVWHDALAPRIGRARVARYSVFEDLGLVAPNAAVHSVALQRATEFAVLLPPRRVAPKGGGGWQDAFWHAPGRVDSEESR